MRFKEDIRLSVPEGKIIDYLLSETHPIGSCKADFFRALGFTKENPSLLRVQLVSLGRFSEIVKEMETPHGTKFVIDGAIVTPKGQEVFIRTIWIKDKHSEVIRLVTAYPSRKGAKK